MRGRALTAAGDPCPGSRERLHGSHPAPPRCQLGKAAGSEQAAPEREREPGLVGNVAEAASAPPLSARPRPQSRQLCIPLRITQQPLCPARSHAKPLLPLQFLPSSPASGPSVCAGATPGPGSGHWHHPSASAMELGVSAASLPENLIPSCCCQAPALRFVKLQGGLLGLCGAPGLPWGQR